jgi:hypothetical protein
LGPLEEEARGWERRVDEYVAEDSDIAEYVRMLEERVPADQLPDASGEVIAAEFERWLRRPER